MAYNDLQATFRWGNTIYINQQQLKYKCKAPIYKWKLVIYCKKNGKKKVLPQQCPAKLWEEHM